MIGKNFSYCRPENEAEAAELFMRLRAAGKEACFYGGGSEIITMCTASSISPDAVIDIKRIPSLNVLQECSGTLTLGAACSLERIRTSLLFPLFGEAGGRIADHTNQCRITLGGNLCGTIIYRETSLPLLLADAKMELFGAQGRRIAPIYEVFDGRMRLNEGELIVSAQVDSSFTQAPFAHVKKVFSEKIGYPALTVCALQLDGTIRAAFSGICSFPFRSMQIEGVINDRSLSPNARAEAAATLLPEPPRADCEGSAEYRLHLFRLTLEEIISDFERGG